MGIDIEPVFKIISYESGQQYPVEDLKMQCKFPYILHQLLIEDTNIFFDTIFILWNFNSLFVGNANNVHEIHILVWNSNYKLVRNVTPNSVSEEIRYEYRFIRCRIRTSLILKIANQPVIHDEHIRPVFSCNILGISKQDAMRTTVPYGECKLPKTHPCVEFQIATCEECGMIDWFTYPWLVWAVAFVSRLLCASSQWFMYSHFIVRRLITAQTSKSAFAIFGKWNV